MGCQGVFEAHCCLAVLRKAGTWRVGFYIGPLPGLTTCSRQYPHGVPAHSLGPPIQDFVALNCCRSVWSSRGHQPSAALGSQLPTRLWAAIRPWHHLPCLPETLTLTLRYRSLGIRPLVFFLKNTDIIQRFLCKSRPLFLALTKIIVWIKC